VIVYKPRRPHFEIRSDRSFRDSLCYAKQRNVPADRRGEPGVGDVWTWVAIDSDTKLVPTYRVGGRDLVDATSFVNDLAQRLASRVQLTTDGNYAYLNAVRGAFGKEIDYAVLVKKYGSDANPRKPEQRYSPSVCIEAIPHPVIGNPDPDHISTSHVERLNLTMRMSMRRYTRLTNAFSKKIENLAAAVSLHFMHYNFCRVHQSLNKETPAMAAGLTDHVWTLRELIGLLEEAESVQTKRGRYAKTRERRAAARDSK
jgi:IS1 family transposase